MFYKTKIETPLGILHAIADEHALHRLQFDIPETHHIDYAPSNKPCTILEQLCDEITRYFAGSLTTFSIPLALRGTPFQTKVWHALRTIPYGSTRSYQDIAHHIENSSAARAVGNANGANALAIIIPCHRVITATGSIGGYAGGIERKQALLELESQIRQRSQ